ncbi:MAG: DUF58 domain-containing protein [Ardenticatenaceae bacterium]
MAYLLGGTLLFSFIWAWLNVYWVRISRTTQALRTRVGNPVEERILIKNESWLPKLWVEVLDESELPGHRVSRVAHGIGPKRTRSWNVKTNARYRGRYRLGPMSVVSGDPFGIFTSKRDFSASSSITIYPATYKLPAFLPPIGRLTGGERKLRRTHNTTPNFSGVREYVPGDALNRIHWRSTARTGRLIVKEFEEDPTGDIWIVLDMHRDTYLEATEIVGLMDYDQPLYWLSKDKLPEIWPTTTEYAVTATASIFNHFLDQNRAVGMIAHATTREIMQPDRGQRQLNRALEYLAVLEAEGSRWLGDLLTLEEKFFTRGTTLVVVSSSPSTTWVDALSILQRRGVRPIAVLINPLSFQQSVLDIDKVQAALAIAGIPTYIINKDDHIADALSQLAIA